MRMKSGGIASACAWLVSIGIFALLVPVGPVLATDGFGDGEVNTDPALSLFLSHQQVPTEGSGHVLVVMEVPPAFHVQFNEFLEVTVAEDAPVTLGKLSAPATGTWAGEPVLQGRSALRVPFQIKPGIDPGAVSFTVTVGYQGCTEEPEYACYPPNRVDLAAQIEVLPAGSRATVANAELFAALVGDEGAGESPAADAKSLEDKVKKALGEGSLLAFLFLFLGGILSSLTPCVFPMIPITISYVGGRAKTRMHGFILSLIFVLALSLSYAILGLVATAAGAVFGQAMQSVPAIIIVTGVFVAMGASMLGLFSINLPSSMTTGMTTASMSAQRKRGGDFLGAVLMGITTGLVAAPCVGPVLVSLLTFMAEAGTSPFMGFWLLFTFAFGLGMLFLVLGTFAGLISSLPGADKWMDTVKHAFGVILIGMAIFYIAKIVDAEIIRLITGCFLVLVGVYMGAFMSLGEDPGTGTLFRKTVSVLVFVTGLWIFLIWLTGIVGSPVVGGGPSGVGGVTQAHAEPDWRINDEAALEEAAAAGRPAIQDFYADWCTACVELDHKTWVDPEVLAESKRFVAVKLDLTVRGETSDRALEHYGVRGMPTVIFYDGQGEEVKRFFGFKGPEEVLEIMRRIR